MKPPENMNSKRMMISLLTPGVLSLIMVGLVAGIDVLDRAGVGVGGGGGGGSGKGDHTDDEEDRFTARITASAVDYTIDEGTGKWAFPRWKPEVDPNRSMQRSTFTEFWTFQWKGKGCKLIRIDQKGAGSRYSGMKNVLQDEKYGAQGGRRQRTRK